MPYFSFIIYSIFSTTHYLCISSIASKYPSTRFFCFTSNFRNDSIKMLSSWFKIISESNSGIPFIRLFSAKSSYGVICNTSHIFKILSLTDLSLFASSHWSCFVIFPFVPKILFASYYAASLMKIFSDWSTFPNSYIAQTLLINTNMLLFYYNCGRNVWQLLFQKYHIYFDHSVNQSHICLFS